MIFRLFGDPDLSPFFLLNDVPIGSVYFWLWESVNPAPGKYNFAPILETLEKESRWKFSYRDQEMVKQCQIMVLPYISSAHNWPHGAYDATPGWVYRQIPHDTLGGKSVGHIFANESCPAYDQQLWRESYYAMVRELAKAIDGHPALASVVVSVGLDSETQPAKGAVLSALLGTAVERWFGDFVYEAIRVYADSFRKTPLHLNNAPGGRARKPRAMLAKSLGVGIKHSGLRADMDSHCGYGDEVGSWDMVSGDNVWIETAYGYYQREELYWMLPAALHYHPKHVSIHSGLLPQFPAKWIRFLDTYLDRTPQTTPAVWAVMRDMEYPVVKWGSSGVSGHPGNWQYWLYASGGTVVRRESLPEEVRSHVFSRQCRYAGDSGIVFRVDDAFASRFHRLTARCTVLRDKGWENIDMPVEKEFVIAREYIHKVMVAGDGEPGDDLGDSDSLVFANEQEVLQWINSKMCSGEIILSWKQT